MKIVHTLSDLGPQHKPVVAAAGFFDGIHLGHQKIIRRAIQRAHDIRGEAWVLTFDTHPLRILNPDAAPPLLTSTRHKVLLLERLGLQGCLLLPFTGETAASPPDAFISELLAACPPLSELVVGRNWRFGRQGRGDPALLSRRTRHHALCVTVAEPKRWKGETISSTRVRVAVLSGRLEQAASMLGRPFSVLGTVVHGEQLGRRLGYPTANLNTHNESLPPPGVYAAFASIVSASPGTTADPAHLHPSVVNFGTRPTFPNHGEQRPVIEVHFLDADPNIYGAEVEVFFVCKLRDEKRFASPADLRGQIEGDIAATRDILKQGVPKKLKEALYIQ